MDLLGKDYPYSRSSLSGKHALIFGASKGIGAATAKMMACAGADVTICARNQDSLDKLTSELVNLGEGRHNSRVVDLEDLDKLDHVVAEILENLGPVHILINNSGGPPGGPLLDNSVEDFHAPFTRHLHAAHKITKQLAPVMEEQGLSLIHI